MKMITRLSLLATCLFALVTTALADSNTINTEKPAFTGLYFGIGSGFYIPQPTSKISLSVADQTLNTSTKNDPLAFSSVWSMGHLWPVGNDYRIGAEFQWRILGGISSHDSNYHSIGTGDAATPIRDLERDVSWTMQYAEDFVFGKVVTPSFFLFTKLGIASEVMETHTTIVSDLYNSAPINHYGEMYFGGNVGIGAEWLLAKQVAFTVEYADTFFQTSNGKTDTLSPAAGLPPQYSVPPMKIKQNNLLSNTQTILLSLDYFFN